MADNPYLAFASPAPAAAGAAPGGNPYLAFASPVSPGPLTASPSDGWASGAAKGLATAAIKGFGDSLGIPRDLGNFADYLVARGESAVTGKKTDDILREMNTSRKPNKDDSWLRRLDKAIDPMNVWPTGQDISAPILSKTGEYVPTSEFGKIAQAGAEAAFSGIGLGAGGAAGKLGDIVRAAPRLALGNAGAGAIGQGVTDLTGDPLLGVAAGVAGAPVIGAASHIARRVGSPAIAGIPGIDRVPGVGSLVEQATQIAAARQLLKQSGDPAALKDWAQQPTPDSKVPGSPQTTAGAIGNDMGLFQAEKDARNSNNLPFNAADRAQSDAQISSIRAIQPNGDVFLPGQMIRGRMDAIDRAAQEAEDRLNAAHQDAVTRRTMASQSYADQQRADLNDRTIAKGQTSGDEKAYADEARQAEHDRLAQAFQDAHSKVGQLAQDAASRVGAPANAEDLGSTLRAAEEEVRASVKKVHAGLYNAVDPNGTLAAVAASVRDKAIKTGDQLKADGSEFDPAEAGLFRRASTLPDVAPYRVLHTLDKDIGAAMSKERRAAGETPAWGRLVGLKSSVKDAMVNAVDNQARHEAKMVDAGLMSQEDTIGAKFAQEARDFAQERRTAPRGSVPAGVGTHRSVRPAAFHSENGNQIQGGGRPGDAQGDQSIQGRSLEPNFDEAAAERLKAANAAYANYAQTYKTPIIAPGLKTTGYSGQYKMPDAVFIRRAVVSGDKGYEVLKAHLAAAKNNPGAIAAMQNAILDPLRKAAAATGTVHPNAVLRWKESYGPALRALDEASPGFSKHFDDAAEATQSLIDIGAQHKQALADSEKSAARQAIIENIARREKLGEATRADRANVKALLAERESDDRAAIAQSKAETSAGIARARGIVKEARATPAGQFAAQGGDRIAPVEVENAVGNLLKTGTSGATRMRSLVQSVAGNHDALSGLRRAGIDWLIRTHSNADGTLSGAKLIKTIRENHDTLKELYPADQISAFSEIARDIEVNSRWRSETAIKSGSDTAKNVKPMIEKALDQTKRHISIMSAATAGFLTGGAKGALVGGSLYLFNSLRSAGIRRVDDLYREALLHPEVAKLLISKMPDGLDMSKLHRLSILLQRATIVGSMQVSKKP